MVCHGVSPAQEQVSTVDVPRASGQIVTGLGTVRSIIRSTEQYKNSKWHDNPDIGVRPFLGSI